MSRGAARRAPSSYAAFTLVEVLVSLAIVTLGAAAVLVALSSAADFASRLRERQFAEWIAQNRISETRLIPAQLELSQTEGEVDYAGERWRWQQRIRNAELPDIREIIVSVSPVDRDAWIEVRGYIGDRVARPSDRDRLWDTARRESP